MLYKTLIKVFDPFNAVVQLDVDLELRFRFDSTPFFQSEMGFGLVFPHVHLSDFRFGVRLQTLFTILFLRSHYKKRKRKLMRFTNQKYVLGQG